MPARAEDSESSKVNSALSATSAVEAVVLAVQAVAVAVREVLSARNCGLSNSRYRFEMLTRRSSFSKNSIVT